VRRKTSDLDGSPPSNRLRLTVLAATVAAFLLVPAAQALANGTLKVNLAGTGHGEVSSVGGFLGLELWEGSPPIKCSGPPATGACQTALVEESEEPGFEKIALHEIPAAGSEFTGWTIEEGEAFGACGSNPGNPEEFENCLIGVETGEGNAKLTATFTKESGFRLTVAKEGTGEGTIASNPSGIVCGEECSKSYAEGAKVTLTASPSHFGFSYSTFVSWKGCDPGGANGRQCTVTMNAAKKVSAKFVRSYSVAVAKQGSGQGKVSSSPGGILCLNNCSSTEAEFKEGTTVSILAAPAKHFHLVKWTGACSGTGSCSVAAIEGPAGGRAVGAEFAEDPQFSLTLTKEGAGNGTVKSSLAGISCGATCTAMSANYYSGTEVELSATPGKGSVLKEWTGACSGSGACKVTMSAAKEVGAKFE
jgi:Divergent InlB B-repeat domain